MRPEPSAPKRQPGIRAVLTTTLVAALLSPAACAGDSPGEKAEKRAHAAIATLKMRLKQRLQGAMAEGPVKALSVCADEAQAIRATIQHDTGVSLGRASLRLRTPADAAPPWVQSWLEAQGERKREGVNGLVTHEGNTVRVLEPIGLEPLCVTCHGPREQLGKELREVLEARYPGDAAVGYAPGDLRGAFWAELAY